MTDIFSEFRKDSGIVYPPFATEYFEKYFYRYMQNCGNIKALKKYIPVFWTEINNSKYDTGKLQTILDFMTRDTQYFAVVQHADGIRQRLPNTIVFSMGGWGGVPLPLIYEDNGLFEKRKNTSKDIFCSFVGANTHPCRLHALNALKEKPDVVYYMNAWTNQIGKDKQDLFVDITARSKFTLAPRGYGKTSFRLYEAFKLNSVPVYIYDTPWLPYTDILDWNKLAVLVHVNDIAGMYERLKAITDEEYNAMLEYYKKHARLFTYEGMSDYIVSKVDN